jgi:branched-chain amino acid transport system ATP-binding protein
MLDVVDLHAGYGEAEVLQGLSLTVAKGEVVCLIGSNGAGKTTTMRTIAGLIRPSAGSITLEGQAIGGRRASALVSAGLAMVPEGRRVFAPLTVRENLDMGAYSVTGSSELERVYTLFPRLRERADQPAGTLSGGEQQMLAIGRALMSRPRLLLLDEPSMGLAPMVVAEIFATIERLNSEGISILLAEQNARMALKVASRGYVLQTGRIVLAASAGELATNESVRNAYLGV